MSFGDYLNPGAAYTKMNQIGVIPRPAGLPLQHFIVQLCGGWLEPKIKSHQRDFGKFHKTRPRGLNQVELSPNPTTTQRIRTQVDLRSNVGLDSNMPEQQKPEPSQSQAGRPRRGRPASNCLRWSYTTATDLRRESRASTRRQWLDGRISRPAGLGEACCNTLI